MQKILKNDKIKLKNSSIQRDFNMKQRVSNTIQFLKILNPKWKYIEKDSGVCFAMTDEKVVWTDAALMDNCIILPTDNELDVAYIGLKNGIKKSIDEYIKELEEY